MRMAWIKLHGRFGSHSSDKALITVGKIVVALTAIISILGGLIDIFQGSGALAQGGASLTLFLVMLFFAAIRIALGYGYYLLLDMSKSGLLVSIAKFFVEIGAGLVIVLSPLAIIAGIIMLFFNPLQGALFAIFGAIIFCLGLGTMFFIEERDKFQIAHQASEMAIQTVPNAKNT